MGKGKCTGVTVVRLHLQVMAAGENKSDKLSVNICPKPSAHPQDV